MYSSQRNNCTSQRVSKISYLQNFKMLQENWVALSKKTVPGLVLRNPHGIFYNPQEHGLSRGCMLTRRKIKGPDKTSWFASQRYYCLARSSHTPLASLHVIKHNVTFARRVCKNETHFLRKRSEFSWFYIYVPTNNLVVWKHIFKSNIKSPDQVDEDGYCKSWMNFNY